MSVLVSTRYDDAFAAWTSMIGPNAVAGRGLSGGYAFTCTDTGTALLQLASESSNGIGTATARIQVAITADPAYTHDVELLQLKNNGAGVATPFTVTLYAYADGHLRVDYGPSGGQFDTSPGVFPFDGSVHGLQLRVVAGATSTFALFRDNVLLLTGSFSDVNWSGHAGMTRFFVFSRRDPGVVMPAQMEAQLEDVDNIVDYPAGSALPLTFDSCSAPVTVVAPIPIPTPLAPQTPCNPQSQISGGGTGNAGCNDGGTGFTPSYSGPFGTVPNHPDPPAGESLKGKTELDLWIALHHVNYPSGLITTYRRSFEDLAHDADYYGGRKEKGLLTIGEIVRGIWRDYQAGTVEISFSEAIRRWIRTILADQDLEGDELEVYVASPDAALAGTPAHVLMRGAVQTIKSSSGRIAGVTAVDVLFSIVGPLGERPQWPFWTFGDVFDEATCPADVRARVIPVLYGEKSDESPVTGRSKGLIPLHYCGTFDLSDSIVVDRPPTPGRTLAALVAALQLSVDRHTTVADWASVPAEGDFTGFGTSDCEALEALGTVPDTYMGLAFGVGAGGGFAGLGQGDVDAWLAAGTTAAPTYEQYGFFAGGLGAWFRYLRLLGTDNGNGDPNAKHDRVPIDVASRSDVYVPGINWPFANPYVEFTKNGRTFRLTGIWAHKDSPLFQDHVNGVVNMTVNAIGIEDVGDGSGLPIVEAHLVQHHWIENFLLSNWTTGLWTTDLDYPQWPDGTAKVRSARFFARQALTKTALGGVGLEASWYVGTAKPLSEHFSEWGDSTETELGPNKNGSISLGYIDETADPTTWPVLDEVVDLYGSIDATYGDNRQNVRSGSCGWDADKEQFRIGPVTVESAIGIDRLKGRRKPGAPLESTILNNADHLAWVLQLGLRRLQFGEIPVTVAGKAELLAYDIDGPGLRLTTGDGRGADGYLEQPMRLMQSRFAFDSQLTSLTLIDIGDVLLAARYPNALDRLSLVTDDDAAAAIVTDDEDLAPLVLL